MARNKPSPVELPEMVTVEDAYRHIGGRKTRYWVRGGCAVSETRPPVLLVHRLGGSVEQWRYTIGPLAERFCVYALDLPGFGRSDSPEQPLSPSRAADFLKDFLLGQGLARASLVGSGLGGAFCLCFAQQYPYMTDRLVLVAPLGFGREVHAYYRLASLPLLGELLTTPTHLTTLQQQRVLLYRRELLTPAWIEQAHRLARLPHVRRAFLTTVRRLVDAYGVRKEVLQQLQQRVEQVTAPTLLLWGEKDLVSPVSQAAAAQRLLPNSRLELLPEAGHLPMVEQAETFNRLVSEFLLEGQPSPRVDMRMK